MAEQPTSSMSDTDAQNENNAPDKQVDVKDKFVETGPDEFCSKICPADLTLIIEGKSLLVSRFLLGNLSPVFDTMLSGDFREKDQPTITLPGKKFNNFVEFMRCMNPHSPKPVTVDNVYDVLPLAHEYEVKHLLTACETTLKKLSKKAADELYHVLKIAIMYDMKDLTSKCIKLAAERPSGEIEEVGRSYQLDTNTINAVRSQMLNILTTKYNDILVHVTTSGALCRVLGIKSKELKLVTAFNNGKVFGDFRKLELTTDFNESVDMCIDGNEFSMKIKKTNYIRVTTTQRSVQVPPFYCVSGIHIKNWMDQNKNIYHEKVLTTNLDTLTLDRGVDYLLNKTAGYMNEVMLFDIELFLFIVNK